MIPRHRRLPSLSALLVCLALAPAARAATFEVTKTADTADGACDADCSLREAVIAANAAPGADTINVPAGTFVLMIAGAGEEASLTGDLDITDSVTLQGAGMDASVIDGGGIDRVFQTGAPGAVELRDLTIRGGAEGPGGGILASATLTVLRCRIADNEAEEGAGIWSLARSLTVRDSVMSGNVATVIAGAVALYGVESLFERVVFEDNEGGDYGGVVQAAQPNVTVRGCDFRRNRNGAIAGLDGDGHLHLTIEDSRFEENLGRLAVIDVISQVDATAVVAIRRTTVENNNIDLNSALYLLGGNDGFQVSIEDSAIRGNTTFGPAVSASYFNFRMERTTVVDNMTPPEDAAVQIEPLKGQTAEIVESALSGASAVGLLVNGGTDAVARMTNSTVSGFVDSGVDVFGSAGLEIENATVNGGIRRGASAQATLRNSIVTGGCNTALASLGHNIDSGNTCGFTHPTDKIDTVPLLGPLQDNGGPTMTHALLAGSPAVNMGDNANCPATDQRGVARSDGRCDIGAYEAVPRLVCGSLPAGGGSLGALLLYTAMGLPFLARARRR